MGYIVNLQNWKKEREKRVNNDDFDEESWRREWLINDDESHDCECCNCENKCKKR